ncbi:FixH family protein [Methylocystis heyeri]|uniref:Nitrogen fixation protein FixH n=1 Tax=Methylocystis heyeri TaxID=391905 RepID=A0A6B8KE06_9HYPH|nr:FixH family protein [Methylocystis heyeri]QGM44788.1 nitrogen fixation protein FixH [Methylocystis heyeri]
MSSCHLVPEEAKPSAGRSLTGWKILAIFLGFFGVVFAVNGVMAYLAVTTFSGEVEQHAYERGLAYNRDIADAREQAARGWKVEVSLQRRAAGQATIVVVAHDAKGAEPTGAVFSARLEFPADRKRDQALSLRETAPGRYEADFTASPGARELVLTAEQGGREAFRSRNRVQID